METARLASCVTPSCTWTGVGPLAACPRCGARVPPALAAPAPARIPGQAAARGFKFAGLAVAAAVVVGLLQVVGGEEGPSGKYTPSECTAMQLVVIDSGQSDSEYDEHC